MKHKNILPYWGLQIAPEKKNTERIQATKPPPQEGSKDARNEGNKMNLFGRGYCKKE